MIINTDDCWLYAGNLNTKGYGRIWIDGRYVFTHRLMWQDYNSRVIPDGYNIDHLCRVHACINPSHLEAVTPRENVLRGVGPPAQLARRDSCKNGHPFSKSNTRFYGNTRRCRKCGVLAVKKHRDMRLNTTR